MAVNPRTYSFNENKELNKMKQIKNPFSTCKTIDLPKDLTEEEEEKLIKNAFYVIEEAVNNAYKKEEEEKNGK